MKRDTHKNTHRYRQVGTLTSRDKDRQRNRKMSIQRHKQVEKHIGRDTTHTGLDIDWTDRD